MVRVVYRKFDGALHWHLSMRWLGEDDHGTWVGLEPGGTMRKGDGPDVPIPHAHVGLFPRNRWWTAWFNAEPDPIAVYCDVTTPPRWPSASEVTMIDLDLDVSRWRDTGAVRVLDEDEFAEHQARYGYPDGVVAQAERTARWLLAAVSDGDEPFATAYRPWLAHVA
ncbi:MAG TPA: DUF402 domain-containing protein [Micromonosporaceae bacterium]|jgi:hypothetical protein